MAAAAFAPAVRQSNASPGKKPSPKPAPVLSPDFTPAPRVTGTAPAGGTAAPKPPGSVSSNFTPEPRPTDNRAPGGQGITKGEGLMAPGWNRGADPFGPSGNLWFYDNTGKFFIVNPQDRTFQGGNDPTAYTNWFAGVAPEIAGNFTDAQTISDIDTAKANNLAGLANIQMGEENANSNFQEALRNINKAKGKSLGSLAEGAADRGMTNSGIFLKSTDDTNDRYNDQTAAETRTKDQQLTNFGLQRGNLAEQLAQAIAGANRGGYDRALKAWQDKQAQALAQAQARLKAMGVL